MTVPIARIATAAEQHTDFQRDVPYAVSVDERPGATGDPALERYLEDEQTRPGATGDPELERYIKDEQTRPEIRIILCTLILIILAALGIVFVLAFLPVLTKESKWA